MANIEPYNLLAINYEKNVTLLIIHVLKTAIKNEVTFWVCYKQTLSMFKLQYVRYVRSPHVSC